MNLIHAILSDFWVIDILARGLLCKYSRLNEVIIKKDIQTQEAYDVMQDKLSVKEFKDISRAAMSQEQSGLHEVRGRHLETLA